jgi:dihydrofolate reductase
MAKVVTDLMVDFITSLDGYASGEGWPGWWGLHGPEYLGWLDEQPEATLLFGANTYRLMHGFAIGTTPGGAGSEEEGSFDHLTAASKVVFSSSLDEPLAWANSTLVRGDAVEAVRAMKAGGAGPTRTIGSLRLCRSLLAGGIVDRFRVVMFPVITDATGSERIYDRDARQRTDSLPSCPSSADRAVDQRVHRTTHATKDAMPRRALRPRPRQRAPTPALATMAKATGRRGAVPW